MAGLFVFKCGNDCGASVEADRLNPAQYSQVKLKPTKCKQCGETSRWEAVVVLKKKPPSPAQDDENESQTISRGVYL